jgi:hypothetical protein
MTLAYVYLNAQLLEMGLARMAIYWPNVRYVERFRQRWLRKKYSNIKTAVSYLLRSNGRQSGKLTIGVDTPEVKWEDFS